MDTGDGMPRRWAGELRWQRQASPWRFCPSVRALEAGPAARLPFAPAGSELGTAGAEAAPSPAWADHRLPIHLSEGLRPVWHGHF